MASGREFRLNVRLTVREHDVIKHRAHDAGVGISEYVRRASLRDDNRAVIRVDSDALRDLYTLLRKSAGLLNQCARELHIQHRPDEIEHELSQALNANAQATEEISAFIVSVRESI